VRRRTTTTTTTVGRASELQRSGALSSTTTRYEDQMPQPPRPGDRPLPPPPLPPPAPPLPPPLPPHDVYPHTDTLVHCRYLLSVALRMVRCSQRPGTLATSD